MNRREIIYLGASAFLLPSILRAQSPSRHHGARVTADPRIELISVVQLLGGYFLLGEAETHYKVEAREYFSPFQEHPAVKTAKLLAAENFNFDAVPYFMLNLTAPNRLQWRTDILEDQFTGVPDLAVRNRFLGELRDFAKVSNFNRFFDRHRQLYRRLSQAIEAWVVPNVLALEAYTGGSLGDWQVIVAPLLFDGGFGPRKMRKNGILETYSIIGPSIHSKGDPDFGDNDRFQELIVHEFSHSLVNPLAEMFPGLVQQYESRFEPMRERMVKVGSYDQWVIVVNEHIVRAVTARIAAQQLGAAAGEKVVAAEVERGFDYLPALIERLHIYEGDRKKWPTLQAYYPELMTAFD